jgi:hypothetical protein
MPMMKPPAAATQPTAPDASASSMAGDQQAPHRGRDHHTRREAQKDLLNAAGHLLPEEKHHRRAQRRHQKRKPGARRGPQERLTHAITSRHWYTS